MNDPRIVTPPKSTAERAQEVSTRTHGEEEARLRRALPRRLAEWSTDGRGQPSLFGEILDWMLAPLLVVWPVSVAIIYGLAYNIASAPYDRALQATAIALASQVGFVDGRVAVNLPAAASSILRYDETDEVYYQVRGIGHEVLAGDRDLPATFPDEFTAPRVVYFRNEIVRAAEIRVAYTFLEFNGARGFALVQVGETLDKRTNLANEIINGVLLLQVLVVPIFLFLVWYGLTKGVAPLNALREKIRRRKPNDLSPIDADQAPEEVRPFILAINDLMSRLDSSLRAQQRFVADAAHQMRTPLAGLKTQAELALRTKDRRELEHAMRQIGASANRASHMVNQLLALAQAEGKAPVALAPLSLNEVVRMAMARWVPHALEKNIDLGLEEQCGPATIEGNTTLLVELVNNLVDNALRYTPAGGCVTVRVRCGDAVWLQVEDNGIGMEEADRELVFERFYRVLGTGTEGSGLGLAIVREIAETHRGRVFVEPNPAERGSVFKVAFPRAGEAGPIADGGAPKTSDDEQ